MAAATTTALEVCNAALLYVGNGQTINDFDEVTQEAKACKAFYAKTRDELLEKAWWKFATKRADLAVLSSPDVETADARSGWAYTYQLPADCLQPRYIWSGNRTPTPDDRVPFDVEEVLFLTDQEDCELVYTFQQTVVARFSALFVEALAWALATKLALVVPVKPELAKLAEAKALQALRSAAAANARGERVDPPPPSEYTSAR